MIWCASTEIYIEPGPAHMDIETFEAAIDAERPDRRPSMLYAYAAILEGVPFANGAPNLAVDTPVLRELATERNVPISGKDFKTGQTLMKTVLAPMLRPACSACRAVQDQHPRQPRRRSARRSGQLQDQGGVEARRAGGHPPARPTPTSTATSSTRCASTTTRLVATTRRAGTTSTSSVGSAIRCRSRSTSSAATHPRRPARARPGAVQRPRPACRSRRHPGVAELLLQEPAGGARSVPRARPVRAAES